MDKPSDPAEARRHREAVEAADEARHVVRAIEDFQDPSQEWRRLFPLAGENKLAQRLSLARGKIARFEGLRQFGWICLVSDGQGGPRFIMFRNLVQLTRLVRQNADHLMDRQIA